VQVLQAVEADGVLQALEVDKRSDVACDEKRHEELAADDMSVLLMAC